MSGMSRDPRREELVRQLRLHLPRILVLFGIGLFVVGIIVMVSFVRNAQRVEPFTTG